MTRFGALRQGLNRAAAPRPLVRVALPLTLLLVLTGCSAGPDSSEPAGPQGADEPADPDAVGAVAGVVVDDERRPLAEAEVRLLPTDRVERTSDEGRFTFAKVPVGVYTLNVTANAHHPRETLVNVTAARTTSLLVILVPLPTEVSFHETTQYSGLQQCMIYTSVYLASCSQPYTAAYYTARSNGVNLSQYGLPEDVLTNKYRYNFSVRLEHTGIVSELIWTPASDAARYYKLVVGCAVWYDPIIDECVPPGESATSGRGIYAVARGVNPLRIEWDAHDWDEWLPWVMSRAYLSGPVDRPAGAALDQRIDMYNTVFYGARVPRDWTILGESSQSGSG